MNTMEKQKQSLYFPEDMLREVMAESIRLDRSLSWTVQQAWRVARAELQRFPAAEPRPPPSPRAERRERSDARGPAASARPSRQVLEFVAGKFDHDPVG